MGPSTASDKRQATSGTRHGKQYGRQYGSQQAVGQERQTTKLVAC